jgi:hypothetical protein
MEHIVEPLEVVENEISKLKVNIEETEMRIKAIEKLMANNPDNNNPFTITFCILTPHELVSLLIELQREKKIISMLIF